ncbi:AP2/ERF family transcription factor [Acetatifactor aquisgranensis]|uniref:AP2/ERF family transcription factor n=1 Tax=Acetatifactor aquisgranensis TaxID=2941233 RepID=UPI002042663C|nr:AP2/ERF family transcription factor [Acetatifactor aquisgranensis]MCI8543785.1 AP2 domain-containing protein [Lachnospiraceae bacterium]
MGAGTDDIRGKNGRGRPQVKDWIGRTFGSLTVVAYDGKRGGKHYWRCRCRCGGEAVVNQSNLQDGHTRSCGCLSNPAGTRHFVEGTCIESIRSRKVSASNKSGIRGVYQNKRTGRWAAQITFQGKTRYLGSFDSLKEAAEARAKAEQVFEEFLKRYGGPAQAARAGQEAGEALYGDIAALMALQIESSKLQKA